MEIENAKSTRSGFNPTPISKFIVTIFLAFNLTSVINEMYTFLTIVFISLLYALNHRAKTAIKSIIFYLFVVFLLKNISQLNINFIKNYVLIFFVLIKIFFVPFFAGKFLVDTSDVSSLIVSFEKMRFPQVLIIPMAVIFRYFPAFKDDKKNIKMAMKMRGISYKNPIKYLEYVSVPMLISAVNIADDISKAAETKCIADPCKKVRYKEVKFSFIDVIYIAIIVMLTVLGRIYA